MALFPTSWLSSREKKSARQARERLQFILTRERSAHRGGGAEPDYLPALQRELLAVIAKYTHVLPEGVQVQRQRKECVDVLQFNIELPDDEGRGGAS